MEKNVKVARFAKRPLKVEEFASKFILFCDFLVRKGNLQLLETEVNNAYNRGILTGREYLQQMDKLEKAGGTPVKDSQYYKLARAGNVCNTKSQ